jgi:hypothetical protein
VNGKVSKAIDFVPQRLLMVVGNYGSGKTEVAVNLALSLATSGRNVQISDLDIVNPYFRCREAKKLMEAHGIRVVVPPASQAAADLPIVLPEIRGMLHPAQNQYNLFDVGGDPIGAKLLSSLVEPLGTERYELWQVINSRRPFTNTTDGCLSMQAGIEQASRLKVTGLVANSHLITETSAEIILEGYSLAKQVSSRNGVPLRFVTAMEALADHPALKEIDAPIFRLTRHMLPPWYLHPDDSEIQNGESEPLPAARAVPLGRRLGVKECRRSR